MEIQSEVLKIRFLQNMQRQRTFSFGLALRPWTKTGAGAEALQPHPHVQSELRPGAAPSCSSSLWSTTCRCQGAVRAGPVGGCMRPMSLGMVSHHKGNKGPKKGEDSNGNFPGAPTALWGNTHSLQGNCLPGGSALR